MRICEGVLALIAAWGLHHSECCQQHGGSGHHSAVPPSAPALRGCGAGARAGPGGFHTLRRTTKGPGSHTRHSGQGLPQGLQLLQIMQDCVDLRYNAHHGSYDSNAALSLHSPALQHFLKQKGQTVP